MGEKIDFPAGNGPEGPGEGDSLVKRRLAEYEKRGEGSKSVDEAVAGVMEILSLREGETIRQNEHFVKRWGHFLKTVADEFPNISPNTLADLELGLTANQLNEENLLVVRLMADIIPDSVETQTFLGHAHKRLGDHERALAQYELAESMLIKDIEKVKEKSGGEYNGFLLLDQVDLIHNRGESELALERPQEAYMSAVRAEEVSKQTVETFDDGEVGDGSYLDKRVRTLTLLRDATEKMGLAETSGEYTKELEGLEARLG